MEEFLNPLENVNRVKVSPFLFNKIRERILFQEKEKLPQATAYLIAASLAFLIYVNVSVVSQELGKTQHKENLSKTFQLTANNTLYR